MQIVFAAVLLFAVVVVLRRKCKAHSSRSGGDDTSVFRAMNLPSSSQGAFIVCTFSMLSKLAALDGDVSEEELVRVEEYIEDSLKLDRKTKKLALNVFQEARESPLEIRDYAEQFKKTYPDAVQLHDRLIEVLVELSVADGRLDEAENKVIRSAALLLGLTEAGYNRIKSKYVVSQFLH